MKLRYLEQKDVPLMIEWMHDPDVVKYMQTDFSKKTKEDCISFVKNAQNTKQNLHLAIVDDNDVYMGTVSLKNIANGAAEFAIAIRKVAMGKGYSKYGMSEIIRIGFEELGLTRIYWYVNAKNVRACRFYNKNGFSQLQSSIKKRTLTEGQEISKQEKDNFIWYQIEK